MSFLSTVFDPFETFVKPSNPYLAKAYTILSRLSVFLVTQFLYGLTFKSFTDFFEI